VKPVAENYKKAIEAFYKNDFAQARTFFAEIKTSYPADSLTGFMYYACGDYRTENMVKVEGGSFQPFSENYKTTVIDSVTWTLTDYYISKYEVTNAQYARFLNEFSAKNKGHKEILDSIANQFINIDSKYTLQMLGGIFIENNVYKVVRGYENRPVASVSWYGADAFCRFYGLQLPSEAQWEFAARGGNQMPSLRDGIWQYAGSNNVDSVAWYDKNSGARTHAVGTKVPNQLGIYDMSGNLWEWCADWYNDRSDYKSATNPVFNEKSSYRVLRGGSWYGYANYCCVAGCGSSYAEHRDYNFGFRFCKAF